MESHDAEFREGATLKSQTVLVCKNTDEPLNFNGVAELLQWIGSKTDDLKAIRNFFEGGFIVDSAGNKYSLSDLP